VTSIATGQLISRFGRYRVFPIVGTAVMVVAMVLLSRLAVSTPMWVAAVDSLVLGLGLGMTMQVLVLATQNAIDPRMMGVATSGSTLFRQIGGSIGVACSGRSSRTACTSSWRSTSRLALAFPRPRRRRRSAGCPRASTEPWSMPTLSPSTPSSSQRRESR
jgi:predicted MFS family arabinose efflux permease